MNSLRGVGMRRVPGDASKAWNERRSLRRIDERDRRTAVLEPDVHIFEPIGRHRALAERQFFRRLCRGLDLQHFLLGELLEIAPIAFTVCKVEVTMPPE